MYVTARSAGSRVNSKNRRRTRLGRNSEVPPASVLSTETRNSHPHLVRCVGRCEGRRGGSVSEGQNQVRGFLQIVRTLGSSALCTASKAESNCVRMRTGSRLSMGAKSHSQILYSGSGERPKFIELDHDFQAHHEPKHRQLSRPQKLATGLRRTACSVEFGCRGAWTCSVSAAGWRTYRRWRRSRPGEALASERLSEMTVAG